MAWWLEAKPNGSLVLLLAVQDLAGSSQGGIRIHGGIGGNGGGGGEQGGNGGAGQGPTTNFGGMQLVFQNLRLSEGDQQTGSTKSQNYCSQLLAQGRGFPLYDPDPQPSLPSEYRTRGVAVGDIGRITPEGGFDFFFNIYLPADHPVNARVPEDFVPLAPYDPVDISRHDFHPGNCLSTLSVNEISGGFPEFPGAEFVFNCRGPDGAVLALPHGSHLEKLQSVASMRQYAARYAESWYKYANVARGRGLVNGSLYLVTGSENAKSWGMAHFHDVSPESELFQLLFKPTTDAHNNYQYRWERTNCHRKHSNFNSTLLNQTTFIHAFAISVCERIWEKLFGIEVCQPVDSSTLAALSGRSFVPHGSQGSSTLWSLFFGNGGNGGGKQYAETAPPPSNSLVTDAFPIPKVQQQNYIGTMLISSKIIHPSQIIHERILRQAPQARVVITHDDDWCDVFKEDGLKTYSELQQAIFDHSELMQEDDVVFLKPKSRPSDVATVTAERQHGHNDITADDPPFKADRPTSVLINTRCRQAMITCTNCRRRKIKCVTTEEPPQHPCARCIKRGLVCEYVAVDEPTSPIHSLPPPSYYAAAPAAPYTTPEDAVHAGKEAVKLCRQLAETDPGTGTTRDLAQSLHHLGVALSTAGRPEDAIHTAEEAVKLRRQLAKTNPDISGDLAWSLYNLGIYLRAAGHPEDAVCAGEEAVKLRHQLAETDPDISSDLARSLYNLGIDLSAAGRPEDAVRAGEEAVKLYRQLAETDPDISSDLAQSLYNLGNHLTAAGRAKDAVHAAEEAVKLHRQLAETNPDISGDLAQSLHNLGNHLTIAGRPKDAVHAGEEAVKLRRQLVETDPDISDDLARSLHNLGIYLGAAGRPEDAVRAGEEAVKLRRQLAVTDPDISGDLAQSLHHLGVNLTAAGRPEDAVCTGEESVKLRRQLAETNPDISSDLARSLYNLGIYLSAAGRPKDAVGAGEEAVKLRRQLAETDPDITSDLAWSLYNLGIYLSATGRPEDAVRAGEEAVKLRRQLAETDPGITRDLASSLHNLGIYLRVAGRLEDAVHAGEEAAKLRRQLAEINLVRMRAKDPRR
ncbi:WD40 containing domain protein [Mycena sanguinolenta]|uniref:WD40 containing domain protein n=1 Tax=Mycena sanguinolenta TaxID=230812 RepID=A0A8H6YX09_9AGAR|nr:WD40 containing domain protein [Mycena sanguinolenta]